MNQARKLSGELQGHSAPAMRRISPPTETLDSVQINRALALEILIQLETYLVALDGIKASIAAVHIETAIQALRDQFDLRRAYSVLIGSELPSNNSDLNY